MITKTATPTYRPTAKQYQAQDKAFGKLLSLTVALINHPHMKPVKEIMMDRLYREVLNKPKLSVWKELTVNRG